MQIKSSLEWDTVRSELLKEIKSVPFNIDLRKLLTNIDLMVKELSSQEVIARRTKNSNLTNASLQKINSAIDTLQKWLVMAVLLR